MTKNGRIAQIASFLGLNGQQFTRIYFYSISLIVMQGFYSTKRHPKKTIIELQALEVGI